MKKQEMITIPFNVEMAKQITNGELPGEITTKKGNSVRIICWDRLSYDGAAIIALVIQNDIENVRSYTEQGIPCRDSSIVYTLQLRVPEWTQYREGDIVYCENPGKSCVWLAILKDKVYCSKRENDMPQLEIYEHVNCIIDNMQGCLIDYDGYSDYIGCIRRATDSERERLINALKNDTNHPKRAKEILKNHFNIEMEAEETEEAEVTEAEHQFQPFDKVLMRNEDGDKWRAVLFSHYTESKYYPYCSACGPYSQCIPYNEQTKHLVGTTENWEE